MAQEVVFDTLSECRRWLRDHHTQKGGVWAVFYKQSSGKSDMSYPELRDEVLCWGWIDSTAGKVDEQKTKIYIAPRKPKSNWSKVNKDRITVLTKAKRIQPSGLAMIKLAKRTGTWDALNDVEQLVVPQDLTQELKKYPKAKECFDAFPRSTKRAILEWILNAKQPATRTRRIQETARLAQDNIRANQPRQLKTISKNL
jgi:uncharacterized protein YdeI (YjbR/CyaY-like superfamily)